MNASNKEIVLVSYHQHSVIVIGIENNLKSLGYNVTTIGDKSEDVKDKLRTADLFLMYLPPDITDDAMVLRNIIQSIELITKAAKKMIFIGEEVNREESAKNIPGVRECMWLSRPVEMTQLADAIESIFSPANQVIVKKKILIVDDDPAYAKVVRGWIKDTYQATIVTAGMQAITFLMKNKVDLILLDYEMPVVDGPQILEMLQSEPTTANIPVVFLTGVGTRESIERVMALKPAGYILKSTTRENLLKYLGGLFAR